MTPRKTTEGALARFHQRSQNLKPQHGGARLMRSPADEGTEAAIRDDLARETRELVVSYRQPHQQIPRPFNRSSGGDEMEEMLSYWCRVRGLAYRVSMIRTAAINTDKPVLVVGKGDQRTEFFAFNPI